MRKLLDKYIVIQWVDSCARAGLWKTDDSVLNLTLDEITSIGRVIQEDEEFITLVSHVATNQLAGEICIPRVVIKKTKVLFHYNDIFNKK